MTSAPYQSRLNGEVLWIVLGYCYHIRARDGVVLGGIEIALPNVFVVG